MTNPGSSANPGFIIPEKLPGAPGRYDAGQENAFRRILELLLRRTSETVVNVSEAPDGVLPRRRSTRWTFDPDVRGRADGSALLPGTAGSLLLDLRSDQALWFRLYANEADYRKDRTRPITTLTPLGPTILDCVLSAAQEEELLARTSWVAGPSCDNSAQFGNVKDNDSTTKWVSTLLQNNASLIFSINFGARVLLDRLSLELPASGNPPKIVQNDQDVSDLKLQFSVDGVNWFFIPHIVEGVSEKVVFRLRAPIYAQYARWTVKNPSQALAVPLEIAEVNASFRENTPVLAYTPLERLLWVAGADCDHASEFPKAIDGDESDMWVSSANQAVGMRFSWDMKRLQKFRKLTLDTMGAVDKEWPVEFTWEVSSDNVTWVGRPGGAVQGFPETEADWGATIEARYVRLTITIPTTVPGPRRWIIGHVNLWEGPVDLLQLRLFSADVASVPAINWDNPATNRFWYAARLMDPDEQNVLWSSMGGGRNAFWTPPCEFTTWHLDVNGNLVIDSITKTYDNCENLSLWVSGIGNAGVEYVDPGGIKPRYHRNFVQLYPHGNTVNIARYNVLPDDRSDVGWAGTFIKAGPPGAVTDTTDYGALGCAYLHSGSAGWDSKAHLRYGVIRGAAANAIFAHIEWVNAQGQTLVLAQSAAITLREKEYVSVRGFVIRSPASTTGVRCEVYVTDDSGQEVLKASADVPQALLDLGTDHSSVGFLLSAVIPPEANFAFGGLAANYLALFGKKTTSFIDIGHIPVERPGGSLTSQPL